VASGPRQLLETVQSGLLRPGPDATYADGDDAAWQTVDWPALTRREAILGRQVNYVDTGGDKPPIVFIHGLGGNWQNWLLQIPAFMDRYRCVALDLPGFGASELPAEPISIRGYGRVVDALCDRLGLDRPVIVGNSMGGFVGAEVAIAFPTRVRALVLISAAGLSIEYLRREPLLTFARLWAASSARVLAGRDLIVRRPRLRRGALGLLLRYPERLSGPLTEELVQGAGKPGFLPALEALLSYSFRDRLVEIEIPVLIVWGRNDMLVPVADADGFQELIGANARKVIFEDTGHGAMIERPSRFNALLREFLRGNPAPEARVEGVSA
jgi:pimeloyl-ACP methyl ester carboxylesterase